MNNKGVILSVYIYVLLVFFLLVLSSLLIVLNNTTILSKKIKDNAAEKADTAYNFTLELTGSDTVCVELGTDYVEPGYTANDLNGNNVGVVTESNVDIWKLGTYRVKYTAKFNNKEKILTRNVVVYEPDYDYTGAYQTFTVPCDGIYNVELWGSAGDTRGNGIGGKGGYTKGSIYLYKGDVLYVYVGEGGKTVTTAPTRSYTFNGGGYQGTDASYSARGGGATDIRLISGAWSNTNSLKSRIMVSGAGGNGYNYGTGGSGGAGGGLYGSPGQTSTGTVPEISIEGGRGATQESAGAGGAGTSVGHGPGLAGSFGTGGVCDSPYGGGGGAGYYGGGGGGANSGRGGGGGGGSSFISGYTGCNAVDLNGNLTDQPVHYSGMQFSDMVMLSGSDTMPSTTGTTETGHSGNGFARIKYMPTQTENYNNEYTMEKFIATGNMNGVRLQLIKPTSSITVMVRKKTTPWTSSDTSATGTLVSSDFTNFNDDNSWYTDDSVTSGTTYYYKAFPLVGGQYISLNELNETSATAGGLYVEFNFENNLSDTAYYTGNDSTNVPTTTGMDRYWKLDGNATDSSGNASNGTLYGGPTVVEGINGSAYKFDGSDDYMIIPTKNLGNGNIDWTVSVWVKTTTNVNGAGLGSILSNANSGPVFSSLCVNNGKIAYWTYQNSAWTQKLGVKFVNNGSWHHLVWVNKSNYTMKMYVDGIEDKWIGDSTSGNNNPVDMIGGSWAAKFAGTLDDFRMYTSALTAVEVLKIYETTNTESAEALIVGGGGGGGMDMGGGGGGGGVITGRFVVDENYSYPIVVGAGGWGAPAAGTTRGDGAGPQPTAHQYTIPGTNGGNSSAFGLTAYGGGFGGSSYRLYTPGISGGAGGSGGGTSGYNDSTTLYYGGAGTSGQGYAGGNTNTTYYSGGGGGAGGVGTSGSTIANGGPGQLSTILGSNYYWGGGGGGAGYSGCGGNGGIGGGGGGAACTTTGGAGINNGSAGGGGAPAGYTNTPGGDGGSSTGGGGGGGGHYNANNKGGNGGSGIVVVRYPGYQKATGGTVNYLNGYTTHMFTAVGTNYYTRYNNISSSAAITYKNTGKVGSTTNYNGASSYAFTPAIMDSGTYSISTWVRLAVAAPASNGYIVSNTETGGFALMQMNGWSSVMLAVNFGGSWDYLTIPNNTVGKWAHIVAVINTTDRIAKLYYNGNLVNQKTYTGAYVPSSLTGTSRGTCIGCNPEVANGKSGFFNGDIDQVKFFSRELSTDEILSLYKE